MSPRREDDPSEPAVNAPTVHVIAQVREGQPVHVDAEPITERTAEPQDVPAAATDVHGRQDVPDRVGRGGRSRLRTSARVVGRRERHGGDGRARRGGQAPPGPARCARRRTSLQRGTAPGWSESPSGRCSRSSDTCRAAARRRSSDRSSRVDRGTAAGSPPASGGGRASCRPGSRRVGLSRSAYHRSDRLPVEQGNDPPSAVRRRLGIHPPEEVTGAVRLEVGDQRRPVARVAWPIACSSASCARGASQALEYASPFDHRTPAAIGPL